MNTELPLVSVVLPTFKRPEFLERAVRNVLSQTYANVELIVVDDNDAGDFKDKAEEIMQRLMSEYTGRSMAFVQHPHNLGGGAARNSGAKLAKGRYVAFLDDDDEWYSEKLEKQIEYFETLSSMVGALYCGYLYQDGDDQKIVYRNEKGSLSKEILLDKFAPGASSTLVFRKDVLQEIGYFDETFQRHQDLEILIRLFRNYTIDVVPEPLLKINGHNYQNALKVESVKLKFLQVFRNEIAALSFTTSRKVYAVQYMFVARLFLHERKLTRFLQYAFLSLFYYPFLFLDYCAIAHGAIFATVKRRRH